MDHKIKYLKYKKKYNKLLSKLKGGYFLGDDYDSNFFLPKIRGNLLMFPSYHDGTRLFSKPDGDSMFDTKKLISIFNSPDYLKLYQHLINEFLDNSTYTQRLSTTTGIIENHGVYRYHINFGAIIFLSYILELELFSLIHTKNGYNILETDGNTIINEQNPSVFNEGDADDFRFYKQMINENNIFSLTHIFTDELDKLFNFYMRKLVINLSKEIRRPRQDAVVLILSEIIPDIPDKPTYQNFMDNRNITLYKFIFVNWKNRLSSSLRISIETINQIIERTMIEIEDKDLEYTAEATGFFSFIFFGYTKKKKRHYGSCITYSILEFYIMSRLHTNGNNMKLFLENEIGIDYTHDIWNYTQNEFKFGVTHWSTQFTLITGIINFRSVFETKNEVPFIKPDSTPNEMFLKALIFPILDNYNTYIKFQYKKDLVKKFINDRSNIINSLLKRERLPVITEIPSYQEIRSELEKNIPNLNFLVYLKDTPIEVINTDFNQYGENLLFFSASNGNIKVVEALVNLRGINLNLKTFHGLTPLHGATRGFDDNYLKTTDKRLRIIDLLLIKGAEKQRLDFR
jgi:hypothetical protein